MFLQKLRTLCEEADWIVKCGRTLDGYRANYGGHESGWNPDDIYDADIVALYEYARNVVAAGRRSSVASHRAIAEGIDSVLSGDYTIANIIDTFANII
jgi:hypothetical protein